MILRHIKGMNGAHFWPIDFHGPSRDPGRLDSHRDTVFVSMFYPQKKSFGGLVLSMFEELELKDARGCCRDFYFGC